MTTNEYPHWIGWDLDGTLAYTDGDHTDHLVIGKPIHSMVNLLKMYIAEGKTCKIFTARKSREFTSPGIIKAIEDWCLKHVGVVLEITNTKDPGMRMLFDDRNVSVARNRGEIKYFLELLEKEQNIL